MFWKYEPYDDFKEQLWQFEIQSIEEWLHTDKFI